MGTEVKTHTKCDRCGEEDTRDGAEGSLPPVGWAEADLTYRLKGSGWTHNARYRACLCPKCADAVWRFTQN
ncbi:hypothetical protein LCGC14_2695890 [marine sediment metagenome]|uniref:Uncharacterized protein n=1 Tax=marine sediment metagenome TaxID=412755 RepID=A0A0F9A4P7_9ZZZZ